jgi:hypothetical protein
MHPLVLPYVPAVCIVVTRSSRGVISARGARSPSDALAVGRDVREQTSRDISLSSIQILHAI